MKNLIVFLIIFFALQAAIGQEPAYLKLEEFVTEVKSSQRKWEKYENIQGSPYLTDEFKKGKVYIKRGKKIKSINIDLNYNRYSNEFEFLMSGNRVFVLTNLDKIEKIVYDGKTFKYKEFKYGHGRYKKGYLQELVKGKYSLFKKFETEFKEEEAPASSYDEYKPARFVEKSPDYFMKSKEEGDIKFISTMRRRKFLKDNFNNHWKKLLKWMRENNINLHNEEELISFFKHLNQSVV
jgi:hypothetical protein